MVDCANKLEDFLKSAEGIDAQYQQLAFAELPYWVNTYKNKCELATQCVANCESICSKDMHGYNLGTPALKPYKREIKTHQNDTIL